MYQYGTLGFCLRSSRLGLLSMRLQLLRFTAGLVIAAAALLRRSFRLALLCLWCLP
jgi:hypothetical protein